MGQKSKKGLKSWFLGQIVKKGCQVAKKLVLDGFEGSGPVLGQGGGLGGVWAGFGGQNGFWADFGGGDRKSSKSAPKT